MPGKAQLFLVDPYTKIFGYHWIRWLFALIKWNSYICVFHVGISWYSPQRSRTCREKHCLSLTVTSKTSGTPHPCLIFQSYVCIWLSPCMQHLWSCHPGSRFDWFQLISPLIVSRKQVHFILSSQAFAILSSILLSANMISAIFFLRFLHV